MRRSTLSLLVLVSLVAATGLLAACGGGVVDSPADEPEEPAFDGQTVLREQCTSCHSSSYVTGASKSESGWAQTVDRMIGYGADLDSAERDALVAFLVQEYGE